MLGANKIPSLSSAGFLYGRQAANREQRQSSALNASKPGGLVRKHNPLLRSKPQARISRTRVLSETRAFPSQYLDHPRNFRLEAARTLDILEGCRVMRHSSRAGIEPESLHPSSWHWYSQLSYSGEGGVDRRS